MDRETVNSWYQDIYQHDEYRMGEARKTFATKALLELTPGSLLDVGCGRGEMLDAAQQMGFSVTGLDVCAAVCDGTRVIHGQAHDLPFNNKSFDVVTLFDVLEHIPAQDTAAVLKQLARVARKHIILTVSNRPSLWQGKDLHITKKPYTTWHAMFNEIFSGSISWIKNPAPCVSELWRIDLTTPLTND